MNELKYFHIAEGCPSDIAHDIFEGVGADLLTEITVYLIKNKMLSIYFINDTITKVLKEKPLTQIRFKQTSCDMWNLLRLFPLMFGNHVPVHDRYWGLLTSFLAVVEGLCTPTYHEIHIVQLEDLIKKFFVNYSTLFQYKPKAHFITHYPLNIRMFGLLIKILHFESKHSYLKNSISSSRNYVSVRKLMAVHHEMLMYLHYKQQESYFSSEILSVNSKEISLSSLQDKVQTLIMEQCSPLISDDFVEARGVTFNGVGVIYDSRSNDSRSMHNYCIILFSLCIYIKVFIINVFIYI